MKKILLILTLIGIMTASAFGFAAGDSIISWGTGFTDIAFSNGYNGFCLDREQHGAEVGKEFSAAEDTTAATSNIDNSDVSRSIKILFTQNFGDVFVSDGNGGYKIGNVSNIQAVIWSYTDNQYIWGEQKTLAEAVETYNGPDIPDHGYTINYNGDVITFDFMVLKPEDNTVQYFFAYKISVNQEPMHEHKFGEAWESDENNHWHECACEEKANVEKHTPKLVGYKPAKEFEDGYTGDEYCMECERLLKEGEVIPMTHIHDYKVKHDKDNHWRECDCDLEDKIVDLEKHESELRGAKPAKEFEDGYTGDEYCKECERLLKEGEVIPMIKVDEVEGEQPEDRPEHDNPNTGDETSVVIWMTLLVVTLTSMIATLNRKKNNG